jgi:hypothetical protein
MTYDEVGRVCSMHETDDKYTKLHPEHLRRQLVDGRLVLTMNWKEQGVNYVHLARGRIRHQIDVNTAINILVP